MDGWTALKIVTMVGVCGVWFYSFVGKGAIEAARAQVAHEEEVKRARKELMGTEDPVRALQLKEILDQDRFEKNERAGRDRNTELVRAQRSSAFWTRQGSDGKTFDGPTWTDRGR